MNELVQIEECLDGSWMVICNGYQWSETSGAFDYAQGCGAQTWPTREEAKAAWEAA